ncbi:MAG: histidinol dehydrogenase [Bradymonadaceae bacterium]|nr:histidinol dehydrogenase [Lujinxingiaceae bacterium]
MSAVLLKIISPDDVPALRRDPVDAATLAATSIIVEDVRERGEAAVRHHALRLGDIQEGEALFVGRKELVTALAGLSEHEHSVLKRTAARIEAFAKAQRASVHDIEVAIPGGVAGQQVAPVERAGCYAPGGRFPLPSSVLMTAITARAAGVETVWVASPRPTQITLAAAALAGADGLLRVGGAQAIAAFAYGLGPMAPCDVVVGPGNRWVTAAKQIVSGTVRIDMLAGPSELVVLADHSAQPGMIAADLLAQAEHDPDALPILIATDRALIDAVNAELERQLAVLPTHETARAALANGYAVLVENVSVGVELCNRLAPEHLELLVQDARAIVPILRHYGGLFIGAGTAEVFGDYGAGPNHTLPTGGTARSAGGLSVFDFLRIRTWMRVDDASAAQELAQDAADLGRMEGLEGHARSAEWRLGKGEA